MRISSLAASRLPFMRPQGSLCTLSLPLPIAKLTRRLVQTKAPKKVHKPSRWIEDVHRQYSSMPIRPGGARDAEKDQSDNQEARPRRIPVSTKAPDVVLERASEVSARAVVWALTGNVINTLGKFVAFLYTGSGTMLSEALHSLADVGNQSLLLVGIKRSNRPPTAEHPYGFEGERFVYALISATGMFFIGACFSIYHGVSLMINPGELGDLWVGLVMLGISGLIETTTFTRGMMAVRRGAREAEMEFFEFVQKGPDPMGVAVIMEDGAALFGICIAFVCVGLTSYTGNPMFDAIGSVLIGTLLGGIAGFLINKNAKALVGRTAPPAKRQLIVNILLQDPMVQSIHHVKALQLGVDTISLKADIEFAGPAVAKKYLNMHPTLIADIQKCHDKPEEVEKLLLEYGTTVVEGLGDEVDRIEKMIQAKIPDIKFIDLESN